MLVWQSQAEGSLEREGLVSFVTAVGKQASEVGIDRVVCGDWLSTLTYVQDTWYKYQRRSTVTSSVPRSAPF